MRYLTLPLCLMTMVSPLGIGKEMPAVAAQSDLNCLIEPYVVITITTPVAGVLETVAVDRGDAVKEGQILATLNTAVERASGAVARAQAELSNRQLAELEVQRTSAEVELRTIRSPINGVVMQRFMSPGEFPKQERILKLAQLDPLRVEVYAPVSMLGKVSVGMTAHVRPESPVTASYSGKVTVVDPVIDAASGMFGIRIELPNPNNRLPGGLKCTVRFGKDGKEPQ